LSKLKNELNNHDDEKLRKSGEEQSPLKTIVGGRPDNREKMINGLPSGIQKLIISASMNEVIKASVIQDPAKAAKDLHIELSDSESAILSSVPVKQLIIMIEGMENNPNIHRRDFLFESAAAIAAVAASALGINAYASQYPVTRGISIDVPPIAWYDSLDRAFNDAKKYKKPLLVVFLHSQDFREKHPLTEAEVYSEEICELNGSDMRREILKYRLIPVRIYDEKIAAGYKTTVFPAVVFLSADGEKLGGVLQPKNDLEIFEALQEAMTTYEKIIKNRTISK
jgi:hypothetical protein